MQHKYWSWCHLSMEETQHYMVGCLFHVHKSWEMMSFHIIKPWWDMHGINNLQNYGNKSQSQCTINMFKISKECYSVVE